MRNGTNGTGTVPGTAGPITVQEAATLFGISDRAVRKRIAAGSLFGEQVKGQWMVYPSAVPRQRQGRNSEQGRVPTEQRNFSDGTGTGTDVAAQFAHALQQVQAPLIARIGELERELGREQLQREQAEQQVQELRRQLVSTHREPTEPEPGPEPVIAVPHRRLSLRERIGAYVAGRRI